ncbi:MAG: ATP synthase subunit alpha [uncultured bacterium (gcode 4)]|uniref:ATP synthase subunit alpha n=1 Tax=uncultured bacterium (gcode 4) TaxID=1234023 RepID=K2GHL2_9BACT|nr:MAG: ATP synthase subunit alpha [uncultured bacterium (gcode 4)]
MANTNVLDGIIKDIETRLDSADINPERVNLWEVIYLWDWIAKVVWLRDISYNELVEFESGAMWVALNLEESFVWIVILSWFSTIREWMIAKKTGKVLEVPVWEWLLGRVVDALGNPIDWLGEIKATEYYPTERVATWVMSRKSVHEPLETGIKALDALVPIGRGQRELIIWDRQTGKTQIAIDTILNQKGKDVKCIYVSIWQKDSKVVAISEELKKAWAMDYTIIVSAWSSAPAAMQWLSPFSGVAMGEYFMFKWEHVLIIYDDLSKHANAYREMSLLLRRPPGREAYPWDVFYLHSRLLERSAKLNDSLWAGSITALPIIETQAWDVSAYVPTNVISITDGQIFLETSLFNAWVKPAINVWLSVSRVGWAAQTKAMKKVAWSLKLSLAQYRELEAFSQFASDLDEETRSQLERGKRMVELLKQDIYSPITFEKQVCAIYAWINWYLDKIDVSKIKWFEKDLYAFLDKDAKLLETIQKEKALSDDSVEKLKELVKEVVNMY